VKLKIAWIGKTKQPAIQELTDTYLKRLSHYAEVESLALKDEAALINLAERGGPSHSKLALVLLDSRGKQLSSEELAGFLRDHQQRAATPLLFAVGPADGFSHNVLRFAHVVLSLGKMTLAHELAKVVLLEQLYRACTILEGHPYHRGH
jgi:23S rRNA (pseudouridine1915-N3)-methyltransferase